MSGDIRDWLESLGLSKYAEVFVDNDIDTDILAYLTEEHLQTLGVSLGNRLRILKAIRLQAPQVAKAELSSKNLKPVPLPPSVNTNHIESPTPVPETNNYAERRPLTVMFCDLADSTALSTKLDPEDLQDVIRAYQETCAALIQEYEGYIARYMGDGILVYYGYPKSLERNAERAVRSAQSIVDAMAGLNETLGRQHDIEIAVRLGIATGMVMVGELIGEGEAQERTVVGEAPNIAARLQGLADRNGIVIGSLTKELSGDAFIYKDQGSHELKGITGLVQTWGVVQLRDEADQEILQDENPRDTSLQRLVGRDEETGLIRRAWQSVKDEGRGQAVYISGEAGLGKSSLIDGLRAEVRAEGLPQVVLRCSPYHTNSVFYPVIEHFKRLTRWQPEDSTETRIEKLETVLKEFDQPLSETVPLLAALLTLPLPEDSYQPLDISPKQQKERTQDAFVAMVLETAEKEPILQLWEDLHWADPSTLELISLFIDQAPTAALLMMMTTRPEFIPPWQSRAHITPITLNRLEGQHAMALINRLAGMKPLPEEVISHIVSKADGVPLYVEELTKTIMTSDILQDTGERLELTGPLSSLSIPDTLQESLMARLDRLPEVREIAQIGSVLGREFAYEMISGISSAEESDLQDGLEQLVDAELLYQRGRPPRAKYIFKHALIQDAAYESLLRRSRQQHHLQVAKLLESSFPDVINSHPELVAHHYSEAGEIELAVNYFQKAGKQSMRLTANHEAIAHLTKGLEIVEGMGAGPEKDQYELDMLLVMGPAMVSVKGYSASEVEPTLRRALALCQQLGDVKKEFSVLQGLALFVFISGKHKDGETLARQMVELAKSREDPGPDLSAARQLAYCLTFQGDIDGSMTQFRHVIDTYDIQVHNKFTFQHTGSDAGVGSNSLMGIALVAYGYPDQARECFDKGFKLARDLDHKLSEAVAVWAAGFTQMMIGDQHTTREHAQALSEISKELGFVQYIVWADVQLSWVSFQEGGGSKAIEALKEAIQICRKIGSHAICTYWNVLMADALRRNDHPEESLALVEDVLNELEQTGERMWQSEANRIKGLSLLESGSSNFDEAEICFLKALEVARSQNARGWELKAATSLAELWISQDKPDQARELLKPVYDWFTEGFDTRDLTCAKKVLEQIQS